MLMVSSPRRMRDTDLQDKGTGGNLKYANSSQTPFLVPGVVEYSGQV